MSKLKLLLIVFIASVLLHFSCNSGVENKNNKLFRFSLDRMGSYYCIETSGWYFDPNFINDYKAIIPDATNYFLKKEGNSLWWHSFEIDVHGQDTNYVPWEMFKRYEGSGLQHIISYRKNLDTLYYYKASLFGDLNKTFVQGKYYYKFKHHELSKSERNFFVKHRDSLIRVKGNNLPKLPEEYQ